jgi:hypothetical protein
VGGLDLRTAVSLLPTPVVTDCTGTRNRTANRKPTVKSVNVGDTLTDWVWILHGWEPGDTTPPWEKKPGVPTGWRSTAGSQLWEDVPLPLPNHPLEETVTA